MVQESFTIDEVKEIIANSAGKTHGFNRGIIF